MCFSHPSHNAAEREATNGEDLANRDYYEADQEELHLSARSVSMRIQCISMDQRTFYQPQLAFCSTARRVG